MHGLSTAAMLVALSTVVATRAATGEGQRVATATIAGAVVTDETPAQPLRNASVTLTGAELPHGLMVLTDADGRFAFNALPAGRFSLTASKPAYLAMSYGQSAPESGPGVPISLADGQQISDVVLKLPRGGIVTGRVVDQRGEPVRGAPVLVMRARIVAGERVVKAVGGTWPRTDAHGFFRAYGLVPGEYLVAAHPPGDYRVLDPSIRTTGVEARPSDPREVAWATDQLRRGAGDAPRPTLAEPPQSAPLAYGAVWYPSSVDSTSALPVTVHAGVERNGVDITVIRQPVARIEGRIFGPDGKPVNSYRITVGSVTMGSASPDGSFTLRNMLPGRHSLGIQSPQTAASTVVEVLVSGEDITDLVVNLQTAPTLSGRVVFEGDGAPRDATGVRVMIRPVSAEASALFPAQVASDGTFTIAPVPPGRYRITAMLDEQAPSDRWRIKSAIVKGRDAVDAPFEVERGQSIANIAIAMSNRTAEIAGTVTDATGAPIAGAYVAVFAVDPIYRAPGSRRAPPLARTATDGTFRFTALPSGAYLCDRPGRDDRGGSARRSSRGQSDQERNHRRADRRRKESSEPAARAWPLNAAEPSRHFRTIVRPRRAMRPREPRLLAEQDAKVERTDHRDRVDGKRSGVKRHGPPAEHQRHRHIHRITREAIRAADDEMARRRPGRQRALARDIELAHAPEQQ